MDSILGRHDTARLTLGFLIDHVGMPRVSVARLAGIDEQCLDALIEGRDAQLSDATARTIRGLAATQSLLLDGYTPAGAAAWMRHPSAQLSGKSPREVLGSGDPAATAIVLRAASARMAA